MAPDAAVTPLPPVGRRGRHLHQPAPGVSRSDPEAVVTRQGGEETLVGVDFFRRALEPCERHGRPGRGLTHTVRTNGTLLTDEFCRLFAEHGLLVGDHFVEPPRQRPVAG